MLRLSSFVALILHAFGLLFVFAPNVSAGDPPEEITATESPTAKINELIRSGWEEQNVKPAPRCSDRTFVRRVYLDLAGRVPSLSEVEGFLADDRQDKRIRLIDALLEDEGYVQHFADLFDALLMGRAEERKYAERVKHGWRGYLENVFRQNRPWNEVAEEILVARPSDKSNQGAVWFLYERNNQHQAIAESVAPAFFGIRIECAQCHDHMMVDEIRQEHYWGLVAFFNRGKNENTPNGPRVAESAIGGFSEFADLTGDSSPNLLTFLDADTVDEPRPGKDEKQVDADELYVEASLKNGPRVPKFSRREKFVQQVLQDHPLLAKAMVNRIWAILMGRGIVHPFDEIDSMHPPSHPELLDWLSDDYAQSGFDIRRLVRSIAACEAYQLQSLRPEKVNDPATFAWYLERPLTAEQLSRSVQMVVRGRIESDVELVKSFRQQFLDVLPDQVEVTVGDALYLSNNESLNRFLSEGTDEGHLSDQVADLENHAERAEHLVASVFGRPADPAEIDAIATYLSHKQDRLREATAQAIWSLVTSAEFRFNH